MAIPNVTDFAINENFGDRLLYSAAGETNQIRIVGSNFICTDVSFTLSAIGLDLSDFNVTDCQNGNDILGTFTACGVNFPFPATLVLEVSNGRTTFVGTPVRLDPVT